MLSRKLLALRCQSHCHMAAVHTPCIHQFLTPLVVRPLQTKKHISQLRHQIQNNLSTEEGTSHIKLSPQHVTTIINEHNKCQTLTALWNDCTGCCSPKVVSSELKPHLRWSTGADWKGSPLSVFISTSQLVSQLVSGTSSGSSSGSGGGSGQVLFSEEPAINKKTLQTICAHRMLPLYSSLYHNLVYFKGTQLRVTFTQSPPHYR